MAHREGMQTYDESEAGTSRVVRRTELLERAAEIVLYFVFRLRGADVPVLGEKGHTLG
jgi:hypothetical protein